MLEQLFGSKTRVKLLRLFLNNPDQPYYLRELARNLKTQLNSVRREVANLERLGIVKSVHLAEPELAKSKSHSRNVKLKGSKKYFLVDTEFILYPELKAVLLKAQLLLEKDFVAKIESLANLKLFILTGIFVGLEGFVTDMVIVGTINRQRLANIVKAFEKELGRGINYTIMTLPEFKYRQDITDRFLYDILERRKIVIVDKINLD
ncbi:MAG: hypothetical protein RB292_02820 [Patescibacteria group bacterium]|jgi:DNA-binding Lrp family transcriptional regulator|nr:hypothetical protein [Patescibacteria group bacterium]